MKEFPDDELDKLFRKSSEELDPQFEPEDWNDLRGRLDQADGKTLGGWLRKWWPAGLLVLLIPAGIAWYALENKSGSDKTTSRNSNVVSDPEKREPEQTEKGDKNNETAATSGTESVKGPAAATIVEKTVENNSIATDLTKSESSPVPAAGTVAAKEKSVSKILPRGQSKTGGVYLEPNRSKGEGGRGALTKPSGTRLVDASVNEAVSANRNFDNPSQQKEGIPRTAKSGERENGSTAANQEPVALQTNAGSPGETLSDPQGSRLVISAGMLKNKQPSWKNQIGFAEIKPEDKPVVMHDDGVKEHEEVGLSPKLAVRVGYSPDLTTVGFKNFTRVGTALSVLLEYGVTRRLYLQTGLVRSKKGYAAEAGEYKFAEYVTNINTPYDVDGVCTMYELPLGFRYDLAQKAQSRWFAGAGLSSYYVQREKYVYHYEKYVHGQKTGWEGKTGLFLFSHLNASVGYERSITRKLSILAEPYVRIPLKGVGYGKVNLLTTGAWISIRYTPFFR